MLRFVIDGNNLLFAAGDHHPQRPPGRSQLCQRIGLWVRRRPTQRRATIVFDGPEPDPARRTQICDPSVRVMFSGVGVPADDVIIAIIRADGTPRTLCVVTSDRAIRRTASGRGARMLRSDAFWLHLNNELARRPRRPPPLPPEKLHGLTPEQASLWLREMGFQTGEDD